VERKGLRRARMAGRPAPSHSNSAVQRVFHLSLGAATANVLPKGGVVVVDAQGFVAHPKGGDAPAVATGDDSPPPLQRRLAAIGVARPVGFNVYP
jgi:hypothetical protein